MTANGAWPEITENIFPGVSILFLIFYTQCLIIINHIGQSAVDRPDLVTQVFYAKQQALLRMIRDGYYRPVAGFVYTIEYQKHGLPHMHLLVFLEEGHKINTMGQVDAIISAQIPDPAIYPQLHQAVTKYMLHGPCSPQRCIENNVCKSAFPNPLLLRLLSRRMDILTMLAPRITGLFKNVRMSLTIDM